MDHLLITSNPNAVWRAEELLSYHRNAHRHDEIAASNLELGWMPARPS